MKNSPYLAVLKVIKYPRFLACLGIVGLCAAMAGCAGSGELLNSDRILRTFGSYGVDVLQATPARRISSLYSSDSTERTTRTYAVVDFADTPHDAYGGPHAAITDGGSIGATFRRAGWQIDKQHIFIGAFEVPATYTEIASLMRLTLPVELAAHVYILNVTKDEKTYQYATITEIHHPAYLTSAALQAIYGEIIFDDSNRHDLQDFIGPPNPLK